MIELVIATDGTSASHDVYRALVTNRAKLAYDSVGAWLEGAGRRREVVARRPALEEQLWLQDRAASLLKRVREQAGALEFETIEAHAGRRRTARSSRLAVTRKNRARDLIEDFMIAANVAIAQYPRRAESLGDPARRARAEAVGPHRRDRGGVRRHAARAARRAGARRVPRARAAPPTRCAFPISRSAS